MRTAAEDLPSAFRALDARAVWGGPTPLASALAQRLGSPTLGVQGGLVALLRSRGGFERRLLALVDGAPFHPRLGRARLRSLEQALDQIGARALELLALALALPLTPPVELRAPGLDTLAWQRRNLLTACAALCLAREGAAHLAEEAFLLGLLDRAGVPLLAVALPSEYPAWYAALPAGTDLARVEREEWGATQAQGARVALADWNLPQRLWSALAAADAAPDAAAPENARERELAGLLVAAREAVRAIETDSGGPALARLDAHTRARGLTTERRDALLRTVTALSAVLGARMAPGPAFSAECASRSEASPPALARLDPLSDLLVRLWRDEPPCATELVLFAEPEPARDNAGSPPWETLMLCLADSGARDHTEARWARWPGGLAAVLRDPDPREVARRRSELEARLVRIAEEAGPSAPARRLCGVAVSAAHCDGPTSRADTEALFARACRALEAGLDAAGAAARARAV